MGDSEAVGAEAKHAVTLEALDEQAPHRDVADSLRHLAGPQVHLPGQDAYPGGAERPVTRAVHHVTRRLQDSAAPRITRAQQGDPAGTDLDALAVHARLDQDSEARTSSIDGPGWTGQVTRRSASQATPQDGRRQTQLPHMSN